MADQSKSPEVSEERLRAWPHFRWFMPILWSFGISTLIGLVMIGVIVLNQKGYLPSWVFGWISSDREIQKRQFNLALFALLAVWLAIWFVKVGVFGEFARTSYNSVLLKLKSLDRETEDGGHARVCALKNVRIAAFLAGFFALQTFESWRALGRPFVEHSLYDLLFRIVILSMIFPVFFRVARCVPERFILGIVAIMTLSGWVFEYVPNLIDPVAGQVRQCALALNILALLISLALFVSALTKPTPSE